MTEEERDEARAEFARGALDFLLVLSVIAAWIVALALVPWVVVLVLTAALVAIVVADIIRHPNRPA